MKVRFRVGNLYILQNVMEIKLFVNFAPIMKWGEKFKKWRKIYDEKIKNNKSMVC